MMDEPTWSRELRQKGSSHKAAVARLIGDAILVLDVLPDGGTLQSALLSRDECAAGERVALGTCGRLIWHGTRWLFVPDPDGVFEEPLIREDAAARARQTAESAYLTVRCLQCGQRNRTVMAQHTSAICGRCGASLHTPEHVSDRTARPLLRQRTLLYAVGIVAIVASFGAGYLVSPLSRHERHLTKAEKAQAGSRGKVTLAARKKPAATPRPKASLALRARTVKPYVPQPVCAGPIWDPGVTCRGKIRRRKESGLLLCDAHDQAEKRLKRRKQREARRNVSIPGPLTAVKVTPSPPVGTWEPPASVPPPMSYEPPAIEPENGTTITDRGSGTGHGTLTVTIQEGLSATVKLWDVDANKLMYEIFVRHGSSATIAAVDPGTYELWYCFGSRWSNVSNRFERDRAAGKAKTDLEFTETTEEDGVRYRRHYVTLYPVLGGNLRTAHKSPNEFDRLR
jgi:ribosomal protein S27E